MGLRYRKSINLGAGFRINISKSGIGYSWGTKGMRFTKTARGSVRSTFSIPGTGISYSSENKQPNQQLNPAPVAAPDTSAAISTEKIEVSYCQSVEHRELLDQIRKVQNLNRLSTIMICCFLFYNPLAILIGLTGIVLKICTHTKFAIPLDYEFDEESWQAYQQFCSTWISMNQNKKLWQIITSEKIENRKIHGGAGNSVERIPATAVIRLPYYLKFNKFKPFGLQIKKKELLFLPDKLLIIDGRKIGALSYPDIRLTLTKTNFLETEYVPSDTQVVGQTWMKVNKDGSPDKRYSDNRQVPVCNYGWIILESGNNLHIEIMCSNPNTIDQMKDSATQIVGATYLALNG